MIFHFSSSRGETKNNFSSRISRDRDSCQGLVNTLTKEVNTLTKEVDTLTKEVATINKEVDAITKEVDTITKLFSKFR